MSASEKCPVCGKRGKRPCPALGGVICPACCGSQRGSKINCPAHCGYFPFGTAGSSLWPEAEAKWLKESVSYLEANLGLPELSRIRKAQVIKEGDEETEALAALHPTIYFALLVRKSPEGRTLADQWEAQDWKGLNNDERYMMEHRRRSVATVIETQQVLNEVTVRCLDVFDPDREPFTVFDPYVAYTSFRFSRFMVWLTHYPHLSRIGGIGYLIPESVWPAWRQEIARWTQAESEKGGPVSVRQYLAAHWAECGHLVPELVCAQRELIVRDLDLYDCTGTYRLKASREQVEAVLNEKPEFQHQQPDSSAGPPALISAYSWHRQGESARLEERLTPSMRRKEQSSGQPSVGVLFFHEDRLILQTDSKIKYEFAKEMVAAYLGDKVEFESEAIEDLGQKFLDNEGHQLSWPEEKLAETEAVEAEPAVPEELRRQLLAKANREHYEKFLDQPLPALKNLSPRAAASDPALKPDLVQVMKGELHVLDQRNVSEGLNLNIDWALDQLGLPELK